MISARFVMAVVAVAGCSRAYAEDAPAPTALPATPMAGPFRSAKAACLAAPACGGTTYDEKTGAIGGPPGKTQCSWPGETLATKGAVLASVQCAAPRGIRSRQEQFYLFVKTAAGWWRAPVFSFAYNDKYCGEELSATWETRGAKRIARVHASLGCVACNKQGSQSEDLDLLLIADPSKDTPVVYEPLVVGQHERQQLDPDGLTDVACPTIKKDVVLKTRWPDPQTLVLSGAKTWRTVTRGRTGIQLGFAAGRAPSSVGTYTLEP